MKSMALLLGVLVGSMATIGCRSDTQRCEDLCVTLDDCDDGVDIDVCEDECVRSTEYAEDGCMETFAALADCMEVESLDCPDALDACDDEIEDFVDDCDEDFEDFSYLSVGPKPI